MKFNIVDTGNRLHDALGFDRATKLLVRHNQSWWVRQLPNSLSLARMTLPAWDRGEIYRRMREDSDQYLWPVLLPYMLALGFTDFEDGAIARRCQVESQVGAMLDPLGDKAAGLWLYWSYLIGMRERLEHDQILLHQLQKLVLIRLKIDGGLVTLAAGGALLKKKGRANHYGKMKFNLDIAALIAGFATLDYGKYKGLDPKLTAEKSAKRVIALSAAACGFGGLSVIEHLRHPEN